MSPTLEAIYRNPYRDLINWGKLLGDTAAVTAMLDHLLHLKCGPRSWKTKLQTNPSALEKPRPETMGDPEKTPLGLLNGFF